MNRYCKLLLHVSLVLASVQACAQYTSDYEVLKGKDDEIVYKGTVTFDDLSTIEDFNMGAAAGAYKVHPAAMKALSGRLAEYNLVVFLGTWCEDSHRMIPQLYRVLQDVSYPLEKLTLQATDHDKKSKGNASETYAVKLVPTIIVLQHGKELGRITEVTDKSVEQDLLKIITTAEQAAQ